MTELELHIQDLEGKIQLTKDQIKNLDGFLDGLEEALRLASLRVPAE